MNKKYSTKSSVKNSWLRRALQLWLAGGLLALPWAGYAAEVIQTNIVRTDGATGDTHNGNIHNIYAGKALNAQVGASTFSKFEVTKGDIANMHFRTSNGQENFGTLLNFVDSKININGTVNAIRQANSMDYLGGHLFFLSPQGMVVGKEGAINAGALTVIAPTKTWWEACSKGTNFTISDKGLATDMNAVPINQSGTICVLGSLRTRDSMKLKAGTINIGTDGAAENATTAKALLKAGVEYEDLVNIEGVKDYLGEKSAYTDTVTGEIVIAAESKTPEDLTSLLLTGLAAGVKVAGGSEVTASGNLTVTATADSSLKISSYKKNKTEGEKTEKVQYIKINDKEMTLEDFEKKYKGLNAYGVTLGGVAIAGATISVTDANTLLEGKNISIKADAKNTYANNAETRSIGADENIGNLIGETLFNALDISFAKMTTVAAVSLGANSIVNATGADTQVKDSTTQQVISVVPALQIAANATTKMTLGTNPTTWETAGSVWMPGVGAIFGNVSNTALVNVGGTLKSAGSTNIASNGKVTAELKATMGKGTTKDSASAAITATLFNLGLVGLEGNNTSIITLANTANLKDYLAGDVTIKALASNSLSSTNEVVGSDGTTAIFGVSWFKYDSNAQVGVATDVSSSDGNLTINGESTYTDNEIQLASQSGSTSEKEAKEAAKAMSEAKAKSVKTLLEDFYKKNFRQDDEKEQKDSKVLGWLTEKVEKYDLWKTSSGEDSSFAKTLSEKITAGVTFGYMEETNEAKVNLAAGTTIKSKGDLNLKAYSHYADTVVNVQGSSTNAYSETASGSALVANGAIMLANLGNKAEVSAVGATLNAGGKLTLDSQAAFEYNRINRMVEAIDDLLAVVVKALAGSELTDGEKKELKEGKEAFEQVVSAFKEDLKDDSTFQKTLKESKDSYKKFTAKIKSFTENETVKNFLTSDLVKGLGTRLTNVETGVEAIIGKAADFLKPANYLNFSVGNTTTSGSGSASQSKLALGITTGITNLDNTGKILLGKDSVLQATGGTGTITLTATGVSSDVALDGHFGFDSAAAGASGANVVMSVGVHNANNNSIVSLSDNAQLTGGTIDIDANTDTLHIGFGANKVEAGSSSSTAWAGVVNYVGGESNNTLTLATDTQLTGDVVNLGTTNATRVVDVTGSLATEGKVSGSVGIGIILLDRENICTVEGSITAQTFGAESLTKGNIVNVAADVAFSKATKDKEKQSEESAGTAAKDTGAVAGALLDEEAEKAENDTKKIKNTDAVQVAENDSALPKATNGSSSSGKGDTLPSFNLSAAASVAVTDLDATTQTLLDGARITLTGGSRTITTSAQDNSVIVTVAGGAALLKSASNSQGTTDSTNSQIAITGSAAVNLAKSDNLTEIKNSTISGATNITNEAAREGVLVAAGAAANLTLSGSNSKNVSVGADCSVNIANYTTIARLDNNTISGTDLLNRAKDMDVQVAGGIQANIITGGTSSVGVGATVTWDILHNDVEAIMKDGSYTGMGGVTNEAITGLTQVTAALSLGISNASGAVVEGSVAVGYLDNQATAQVAGITLTGDTFTSKAYDTVYTNQQAQSLGTDLGIDTEGTNEAGEEYTTAIAGELGPSKTATEDEKYVDNTALQVSKQGNKMVTAAVQISGIIPSSDDDKSSASLGAAVVVNQYNNDFESTLKGSTITLQGAGGAQVLADAHSTIVGVAAGGNGASKGFAGGGSVVVSSLGNKTLAQVEDSTLAIPDLTIKATNNEKVVNVAGAVAIGKHAAGLDIIYNSMNTLTEAYLKNSNLRGDTLQILADNEASVYGVAVGVDVATGGVAIGGSAAVNVGKNSLEAAATSEKGNTLTLSQFTMQSKDNTTLVAAAGGLSLGSKVAIGGALAWNELKAQDSQYNLARLNGYTITLENQPEEQGELLVEAQDTAKITTVGVGCGLSGSVAVQGADATAKVTKQTSATMENTNINNANSLLGDVQIKASTENTLTTVGVVVSIGKYGALGAGTTQNFLDADTLAKVTGEGISLRNLTIDATSKEKIKNVAVGVAASTTLSLGGSVVVNTMDNDTSALLGDEDSITLVRAAEDVSVQAEGKEDLYNLCGQVSASAGGSAAISGGFAVAVDTIRGNTIAKALNAELAAKNLSINAEGNHILKSIPFVAAAGASGSVQVGAGATVGVVNISGDTLAEAISLDYNKDEEEAKGNLTIAADDNLKSTSTITSAAAGGSGSVSANLGVGVEVNKNTRKVQALLKGDDQRQTINAKKVSVTADSAVTLEITNTAISAGLSGGGAVDVTGNVNYVKLEEETIATVENIFTVNNGLDIQARHNDDISLYGTSVAVSVAGTVAVSGEVGINVLKNNAQTSASLKNSKVVHYVDGQAEDVIKATNNSTIHTREIGISFAASLWAAGAGVLVGNNTLEQSALAGVYNSTIGTESVRAKSLTVGSKNNLTTNFDRDQITGSTGVAVGVGVSLNKVDSVSKVEMEEATAYADSITLQASDTKNINGEMTNMTGGLVAVGVSTLYNYIGTAVNKEKYDGADIKEYGDKVKNVGDSDFDEERVEKDTTAALSNVNDQVFGNSAEGQKGLVQQTGQEEVKQAKFTENDKINSFAGDKEGALINLRDTSLHSVGNLTLQAQSTINTDTSLLGGGAGLGVAQVEINKQGVQEKVGITIEGGNLESGNGNIILDAESEGTLKNTTTSASVGGAVLAFTLMETKKSGKGVSIALKEDAEGKGVSIAAAKELQITAKDALGIANNLDFAAVSMLSVAVNLNRATDDSSSSISLSGSNSLRAGEKISLGAQSVPNVTSKVGAVTVSGIAGTGSISTLKTTNTTSLNVEDGNAFHSPVIALSAEAAAPHNGSGDALSNLESQIASIGVSLVGIAVSKSVTESQQKISLRVQDIAVDNGEGGAVTSLTLAAKDGVRIKNDTESTSAEFADLGDCLLATSKAEDSITLALGTEDSSLSNVDNLIVTIANQPYVNDFIQSRHGALVGVNLAGYDQDLDSQVTGSNKLTLQGQFNVGSMNVCSTLAPELQLNIDLVNISGIKIGRNRLQNEVTLTNAVTLDKAVINSKGGIALNLTTEPSLNKSFLESIDKSFSENLENVLLGATGGAFAESFNNTISNKVTIANNLLLQDSKLVADGAIDLSALSKGVVCAVVFDTKKGDFTHTIVDELTNSVVDENSISLQGASELSTTDDEGDITLSACDQLDVTASCYAHVSGSASGDITTVTDSVRKSTDKLDLQQGKILSQGAVNLYAGKTLGGEYGGMNLTLVADGYNGAGAVGGEWCRLESAIEQNREVNISEDMDVLAKGDVAIFAADGWDSISMTVRRIHSSKLRHDYNYTEFYDSVRKDAKTYDDTAKIIDNGTTANGSVKIAGTVQAGVGNNQQITIGQAGVIVVADEAAKAALDPEQWAGYSIYTAQEFLALDNEQGITIEDTDDSGLTKEQFVIDTVAGALAITLPDLVGGGGDVKIETKTLTGAGSITAKGCGEISLTNNTNLQLRTQDITMADGGGEIFLNGTLLDDARKGDLQIEMSQAAATPVIDISGTYGGGEDSALDYGDIVLDGTVLNNRGKIQIYTQGNDIVLGFNKTLRGKTVIFSAPNGNIRQSYYSGIQSLGSPESQYGDYLDGYVQGKSSIGEDTWQTSTYAGTGADTSGSMLISGGTISLTAATINVDGLMQSGYERYFVELNDDAATRKIIEDITINNGDKAMTDAQVLGNKDYQVVKGGYVLNSKGYYDYQVGVYYNPTTDTLLTEDVESSGGKIYLNGKVISTGQGAIYCLDGAYNVEVINNLSHNLKTGQMVVQSVEGLVKITDSESGNVTSFTKDSEVKVYSPESGARYNWSKAYSTKNYKEYWQQTYSSYWKYEEQTPDDPASGTLQTYEDKALIQATLAEGKAGIGAVADLAEQEVGIKKTVTTDAKTTEVTNVERWATGKWGAHQRTRKTYLDTTPSDYDYSISLKADNPISINFIGVQAEESSISVKAQDLTLGGDCQAAKITLQTSGGLLQARGTITADTLKINSSATIDLQNSDNQIRSMDFSAAGDITVLSGGIEGLGAKLGLSIADNADINVEITNDLDEDGTVNGDVKVQIMATNATAENELDIISTVQAQGDIYLTNGQGDLYNHDTIYSQEGDIALVTQEALLNEGRISTDKGNALLFGYGSEEVEGYAVSVANLGAGDVSVTGGEFAMYGTQSVMNTGDIWVKKNAAGEGGDFGLYSTKGDVLNLNVDNANAANVFQVEGNLILHAPEGSLINQKGFSANDDLWLIYGKSVVSLNEEMQSKNGNVIVQAAAGSVLIGMGTRITAGDSVVIGSKLGTEISGNIVAQNGLVAVGAEAGDVEIIGNLTGETVSIYTESAASKIKLAVENITATKELILATNNYEGDLGRLSKIETLSLYGAGRTQGGDYYIDSVGEDVAYNIRNVNVNSLKIATDKPLEIAHLAVADKAELTVMGTKTSVYGKMQEYDGNSKVIYYAPGKGSAMIDLHDLYFSNVEDRQPIIDKMKEDSANFVTGDFGSSGQGMTLSIQSAQLQWGDGILLRNYYGQKTYLQRFSLEQMMQNLLEFKAPQTFNDYFHIGNIDFYQTHNVVEIPEVTVNSGEKIIKELEWEF